MTGSRDLTGKQALDFTLKDSQGRQHSMQEYLGSWVLLVFHRHLA